MQVRAAQQSMKTKCMSLKDPLLTKYPAFTLSLKSLGWYGRSTW